MDGAGSLNWWTEFGDPLRKVEVPGATQRFHMQRSIEQIREDFGVTPLFLMRGGGGHSRSYPNHSARIAAQLGFGLSELAGDEYLGPDFVIDLRPVLPRSGLAYDEAFAAASVPWTVDAPLYLVFHDRDVAMDMSSVDRLLDALGDVRYMTANEYCAYLHARIERREAAGGELVFRIHYDDHYCRRFGDVKSTWTLHLSDDLRRSLGPALPEKQSIVVPKGLGEHTIKVGAGAPGVLVQ
jgi:hypothetical protein